jgi:hypothetical protein
MAVDDDDIRLPLVLGPVSNGEFVPLAAAPAEVRMARAVLDRAAAAADALAMASGCSCRPPVAWLPC